MAHPNADRYRRMMGSGTIPAENELTDTLADDVRWHEAGNPQAFTGRQAVMDRLHGMSASGGMPTITLKSVLADDDAVVAVGHASFDQSGEHLEYDYVEYLTMREGKITERWSYMDAVPDSVSKFFSR